MTILITDLHGDYVGLTCGRVSATVGFPSYGGVSVCCHNASNRVWGKSGRYFRSVAEALDAYRSPEMKAMIRAAYLEVKGLEVAA